MFQQHACGSTNISVHVNNLRAFYNYYNFMAKHTKDESAFQLVRQKSGNMNEVCAMWCKSLILIMLYVVMVAVLHYAVYLTCFAVWVCGFVNCVQYFGKTRLVCKIVFQQLEKKL